MEICKHSSADEVLATVAVCAVLLVNESITFMLQNELAKYLVI